MPHFVKLHPATEVLIVAVCKGHVRFEPPGQCHQAASFRTGHKDPRHSLHAIPLHSLKNKPPYRQGYEG
jgi:hypothetical protein